MIPKEKGSKNQNFKQWIQ